MHLVMTPGRPGCRALAATLPLVLTLAATALTTPLLAGCEEKIQSPNGSCSQTPGQCGYPAK